MFSVVLKPYSLNRKASILLPRFSRSASLSECVRCLTSETVTSQVISAGIRFSGCFPQITQVGERSYFVFPKNRLFLRRRRKNCLSLFRYGVLFTCLTILIISYSSHSQFKPSFSALLSILIQHLTQPSVLACVFKRE